MNCVGRRVSLLQLFSSVFLFVFAVTLLSCSKSAPQPKPPPSKPSDIKIEVRDGGPAIITTSAAEFEILPSGFVQATLVKDGKRMTLDEPAAGSSGGSD